MAGRDHTKNDKGNGIAPSRLFHQNGLFPHATQPHQPHAFQTLALRHADELLARGFPADERRWGNGNHGGA